MRRMYYGGSFNPIHHGHLVCARAVAELAGFDRVVLIPSANPPHKVCQTDLASAEHRLAMCQLAIAGEPLFAVDPIEIRRPGKSYTIETVRQLKAAGEAQVFWLVGGDTVDQLPLWHRASELLAETQFVVMARPGWMLFFAALPAELTTLQSQVVPAPQLDISSSDIRRRVAAGRSIRYLTPQTVIDYVEQHGLYRSPV